MAKINRYPVEQIIDENDLLLGSDNSNNKATKQFRIKDVVDIVVEKVEDVKGEKDPTVPEYVKAITEEDINKWNNFVFNDNWVLVEYEEGEPTILDFNGIRGNFLIEPLVPLSEPTDLTISSIKFPETFDACDFTILIFNRSFNLEILLEPSNSYELEKGISDLKDEVILRYGETAVLKYNQDIDRIDIIGVIGNVFNIEDYKEYFTFQDDITVMLSEGKSFGKFVNGDKIYATNKTALEIIKEAVTGVIYPTFVENTLTTSIIGEINREVGKYTPDLQVQVSTTLGFVYGKLVDNIWRTDITQGTYAGNPITFKINDTDVVVSNGNTFAPSFVVSEGNNNIKVDAKFSAGVAPVLSNGDPYTNPYIGGIISKTLIIKGFYKAFTGSSATTPTNYRDLTNTLITGAMDIYLNTGTDNKEFYIAIPNNRNLVSVIDTNALNSNITSSFVLLTGTNYIKDGGSNDIVYKIYKMTVDIAYSTSHNFKISIT